MSDFLTTEPIESPCKLICAMDLESGYCFGCGRSKSEIADWGTKSQDDRDAIMAQLPSRMGPLEAKMATKRETRKKRT